MKRFVDSLEAYRDLLDLYEVDETKLLSSYVQVCMKTHEDVQLRQHELLRAFLCREKSDSNKRSSIEPRCKSDPRIAGNT
jgi:hypothetical protein